jgi:hypothetical protein
LEPQIEMMPMATLAVSVSKNFAKIKLQLACRQGDQMSFGEKIAQNVAQ